MVNVSGVMKIVMLPLAAALLGPQAPPAAPDVPSTLVAKVREATAPFLDVNRTHDAHYEPFLGCVSGPEQGAMGVHFVNLDLVGDGEIDVNHPEALIYEPRNNNEARLVGVEYLVIAEQWHAKHPDAIGAPVLEGQVFHFNDAPNRFGLPAFYELHVWAWQQNPQGAFVDWNSLVSCDRAR